MPTVQEQLSFALNAPVPFNHRFNAAVADPFLHLAEDGRGGFQIRPFATTAQSDGRTLPRTSVVTD
jgi:hypothetical protein